MHSVSVLASFCVALLLASSPAFADTDYDSGDDPNDRISGGGYKKRNLSTSYFPKEEEAYVDPFATPSYTPTYTGDLDCGDPGTAQAMRDVVESGGSYDPHDLDRDGDGIPCEW